MSAASETDAKSIIYLIDLKECSSCDAGVVLKRKKVEQMDWGNSGEVFCWVFCGLVGFFFKVSDFDILADSLLLLTSLLACEAFFDQSMFSFNEVGWSLFCCCSTN